LDEQSDGELKRHLQGQLNRLSEKNLSSILNEIEQMYRRHSRAAMNSCLFQLYNDLLMSTVSLTGESLVSEHALLACLLHGNVALEIGSFLLENFLQMFVEHVHDDVPNKTNDNLIVFVGYAYAFYMCNGKLLFDMAEYLVNVGQLNEKRLELILVLLRTVGFLLRKDNPVRLKLFLQQLRSASTCLSSSSSSSSKRVQFMVDTITSLKNNDVRKLPGAFEPERVDRLRKLSRTLLNDKGVQQANMLNVGLDDFLNVHEQGRWWVVGSAWQKQTTHNKGHDVSAPVFERQFDEKIQRLAKEQHMNTDVRRMIFATLLTSEVSRRRALRPGQRSFVRSRTVTMPSRSCTS
jgi:nucleolar MIF4G domain-containing protein 1